MKFNGLQMIALRKGRKRALGRSRRLSPLSRASSAALWYSDQVSDEEAKSIKHFKDFLLAHDIEVQDYQYTNHISKDLLRDEKRRIYSKQDFGLMNKIKNVSLKDLIHTPYDYFVNCNLGTDFHSRYIIAASRARCKVGRYDAAIMEDLDLMIKTETPGLHGLFEEVVKQLKKLNHEK